MKLALLADIHSNSLALDAVLADVERHGGVDGFGLLGDYCAIGPDPVGTLERLAQLPLHFCIRGNTDRFLVTNERPEPSVHDAQQNSDLVPIVAEIAASFSWTQGAITAAGWYDWLHDLPLDYQEVLPDSTRLLAVHAAPGRDDNPALERDAADMALEPLLAGCAADLVLTGHTHHVHDRMVAGIHLVNPGSVSNPKYPDLRAKYAILSADPQGYGIEQRYVDYDHEAVIALLTTMHHPAPSYIIRFIRGEIS